MAKGNKYERNVENYLWRRSAVGQPPATCELALYANGSPPGDAGGGTELTVAGYVRASVSMNVATWGPLGSPPLNQGSITCGTPSVSGIAAGHFALIDPSDSSVVWYGNLQAVYTTVAATPLTFAPGKLGHTED